MEKKLKKKRILSKLTPWLLLLVMFVSIFGIGASAAGTPTVTQNGLTAEITTDKENYEDTNDIAVTVKVTNGNTYSVQNVKSELKLPDGFSLSGGSLTGTKSVLASGESTETSATVVKGTIEPITDNPNIPKTGATLLMALCIVLLSLSAGGLLLYSTRHKKSKSFIAFTLCFIMLFSALPLTAFAANEKSEFFTVTKDIKVGGETVTLSADISCDPNENVTVKFETNGGTKIDSVTLEKGQKLSDVPTSEKTGFAFTGWYTDSDLSEQFYKDLPIMGDETLYASYSEREDEFTVYQPTDTYIEDQSADYSFTVVSNDEITAANLSDYLTVDAISGDLPTLTVTGNGNKYTISPETPYTAGGYYEVNISADIAFADAQIGSVDTTNVKKLSFRIHKDDVNEVDYKDGIITLDYSKFLAVTDRTCVLSKDDLGTLTVGSILFIKDESNQDNCRYVKVTAVEEKEENTILITFENCSFDEIYDKINIYYNDLEIKNDKLKEEIDTEALAQQLYSSEGTKKLTYMLAAALSESPTVFSLGDGQQAFEKIDLNSLSDNTSITSNTDLSVKNLIDGLTITASVGEATNSNFVRFGVPNDNWSALGVTFTYEATLRNKVKIKASINVTEYLSLIVRGYNDLDGTNFKFDYALNTYSQTDISFTILVCSSDGKDDPEDDEYQDISYEITSLINDDSSDSSDSIVAEMKEMLESDGGAIELCRVPMFKSGTPVALVLQVNVDVDFVLSINFAAGLKAEFTYLNATQVGMSGQSKTGETKTYRNTLIGSGRYDFDIYACGYVGIKAGVEAQLSLSFTGLADLGKVGIGFQLGVYIDLYGYMHYQIENTKIAQFDGTLTRSLTGGIYLEVGIYFEINVFASSEVFDARASYTVFEIKLPVFSAGDKYVLEELKVDSGSTMLVHGKSVPLSSVMALEGDFLDITTGKTVTKQITDGYSVQFASPYIKVKDVDGVKTIVVDPSIFGFVTLRDGTRDTSVSLGDGTFDTTVYIYYKGQMLVFNSSRDYVNDHLTSVYAGEEKVTWVDDDIDINSTNIGKTVTATFVVEADGEYKTFDTREVIVGKVVGGPDVSGIIDYYVLPHESDDSYWDVQPYFAHIDKDTTFTIHTKHRQVLIGYDYWNGDNWVAAVQAVNYGEVPNITVPETGGMTLSGWSGYSLSYGSRENYGENFKGLQPVEGYIGYVTGYDTTKPITEKVCDSRNDAYSFIYTQTSKYGVTYACYSALYNSSRAMLSFNVTTGTTENPQKFTYQDYYLIGETPFGTDWYAENAPSGLDFIGWDANDDGIVDYPKGTALPTVKGMATYTAIYSGSEKTIRVYNSDGTFKDYTLTCGDEFPDEVYSDPVAPTAGAGESYKYGYWTYQVSCWDKATSWSTYKNTSKVWWDAEFKPVFTHYYTVTVNSGLGTINGQTVTDFSEKDGSTVSLSKYQNMIKVPTSDYYTYTQTGWTDADGNKYGLNDSITTDKAISLTAVFDTTEKVYTANVTTEHGTLLNGNMADSYSGGYDGYVAFVNKYKAYAPSAVEDPDYTWTFSEIYSNSTYDNMSTTMRVIWTKSALKQYDVTYVYNNGTADSSSKEDYGYNISLAFPGIYDTDYCSYKFMGWDMNDDGVADYAYGDQYNVKGTVTFKAIWAEDNVYDYHIILEAGSGTFLNGTNEMVYTGHYGDKFTITPEIPSAPANMVFTGWDVSVPTEFTNKDVTLRAKYDYQSFTITCILRNNVDNTVNNSYAEINVKYGDTITADMLPATPTAATGRLFSGWSKVNGGTLIGSTVTGNMQIQATIDPVYVIYTVDSKVVKKTSVLIGDTVTVDANPTGYSAWASADIDISGGSFKMPSKNVTITSEKVLSGNMYITDGTNTDAYDTINKKGDTATVSGYTFDKDNNFLVVNADGLTISGTAKNIAIVVSDNVKTLTLKDFSAATTEDSSYAISTDIIPTSTGIESDTPGFNDFLIYSKSPDFTLNIDGDVSIIKKNPSTGDKAAIQSVPMGTCTGYDFENKKETTYYGEIEGTINIKGISEGASLVLTSGCHGLDANGKVTLNDLKFETVTDYSGLYMFNASSDGYALTADNCTLKSSGPNTAIEVRGSVSINDCMLDLTGEIDETDNSTYTSVLEITGKTNGIVTGDSAAISADSLSVNLASGSSVKFTATNNDNPDYTAAVKLRTTNMTLAATTESSVTPINWHSFGFGYPLYGICKNTEDPYEYYTTVTFTGK